MEPVATVEEDMVPLPLDPDTVLDGLHLEEDTNCDRLSGELLEGTVASSSHLDLGHPEEDIEGAEVP